MAEVQKTVQTGELTQRFIEFVMMHAQNAALFLGQIPNPKTGEPEVNLDLARMFIDQLEMIQEKTRGNLTNEESMVLRNALSNLQMAYVEVAQETGATRPGPRRPAEEAPAAATQGERSQPAHSAEQTQTRSDAPRQQPPPIASTEPESESRKKFSKSYGP